MLPAAVGDGDDGDDLGATGEDPPLALADRTRAIGADGGIVAAGVGRPYDRWWWLGSGRGRDVRHPEVPMTEIPPVEPGPVEPPPITPEPTGPSPSPEPEPAPIDAA